MIENRQLYSFEEQNGSNISNPVENEPEAENWETGPPKLMYQTTVAIFCLIFAVLLCRQPQGWAFWLRERLHYAINTSSEASFGRIWNSAFFQSIVRNSNNLIRLEKVTQTLSGQNSVVVGEDDFFKEAVWPVPGTIIKEYGWGDNQHRRPGEFNTEVVIRTTDKAGVKAIAPGEIARIIQKGDGWLIEINHGSGWRSIYHPLSEVKARVGQPVAAGQVIGRAAASSGNTDLSFAVRHYGQPADPCSLIRKPLL